MLERFAEVDGNGMIRYEDFDSEYPDHEAMLARWKQYVRTRVSHPDFSRNRDDHFSDLKPYYSWRDTHEYDLPW